MLVNGTLAEVLAVFGEPMLVPTSAMLFDDGELCTGAYVIKTGRVDLLLLNAEGVAVWSRTVQAGAILGLAAAVGMKSHCLRAVALDETELVYLPAEKVQKLIRDNATVGVQIIKAMSEEV